MTRPALAVVTLVCLVIPAAATTARQKPFDRPTGLRLSLAKLPPPYTVEVPPPAEAQLTAATEVVLDGKRCEYKDIPATAAVVRMVLAPDGETITRVEFRSGK